MSLIELWKLLHMHFNKQADLAEVCIKLQTAGQIKATVGGRYIPVKKEMKAEQLMEKFIDFSLLTDEERNYCV